MTPSSLLSAFPPLARIADAANTSTFPNLRWPRYKGVGDILAEVSIRSYALHGFMLSSLVANIQTGMAGQGFAPLGEDLTGEVIPPDQVRTFWLGQLKKAVAFYTAQAKAEAETPQSEPEAPEPKPKVEAPQAEAEPETAESKVVEALSRLRAMRAELDAIEDLLRSA